MAYEWYTSRNTAKEPHVINTQTYIIQTAMLLHYYSCHIGGNCTPPITLSDRACPSVRPLGRG
jgi:hypothetical protein